MKSCNKKCLGCGAHLTNDKFQVGYVNKPIENVNYCIRCFRLKNYSEIDNSNLNIIDIEKQINELDYSKSIYIFHVVDVMDLDNTVLKNFLNYQNKLIFIVNKMDCLPKQYNAELTASMIYKTIESYGYKDPKIIFSSSFNKSSIKKINKMVVQVNVRKLKALFVGCSNVGKSSLINQLLKLNEQDPELTVSPFINTTILLKQIKIGKNLIIDTPGLPQEQNILNYVDNKNVKRIMNFNNSCSINYFINPEQTLQVENLLQIHFIEGIKSTFTFYISKELKINRMKSINAQKNWELSINNPKCISYLDKFSNFKEIEFILDEKYKHNLDISGLGLITINKGVKKIKVKILKEVGVSISKYAII